MAVRYFKDSTDKFFLPENKEQWEAVKKRFMDTGIEDTPESWTFILSQLQNTKMPELVTSFNFIINHYRRWKIAKVLQDEKTVYIAALQDKLKEKIEAMTKEMAGAEPTSEPDHVNDLPIGPLNSEGPVPRLPEAEERVVQSPSW